MVNLRTAAALWAALYSGSFVTASPVAAWSGVCDAGIYGELSPILKQFDVAVEFCRAVYPVCGSSKGKREPVPGALSTTAAITTTAKVTTMSKTTTKAVTTTPKKTTTAKTSAQNPKSSAWSKCKQQPANVISTMCSCIVNPTPCKTTARTSKPTMKTTSSSSKKTTPVTTTPVITTPVITTPVITTPVTTTPSTTTSSAAPVGPTQTCTENGPIQATNGELYSHFCDYSYPAGTVITVLTGFTSVNDCVEACSQQLPACRLYNYNRNVDVGGAGASCTLLSSSGGSGLDTPGIDSGIYQV